MMIETTLGALVEARPALVSVANKVQSAETSMKSKYHVAKLLRLVTQEVEAFDAQRIALCDQYGTKNGDGYEIPPAHRSEFGAKLTELTKVPAVIPWGPVEFGWLEKTTVTALELERLMAAGMMTEPAGEDDPLKRKKK